MQKNSIDNKKLNIEYEVGSADIIRAMVSVPSKKTFDEEVVEFLHALSRMIYTDVESKLYPDVVTFAFWIRKSSIEKMKQRFDVFSNMNYKIGRGVAFHIAPSNVAVNYAYSLVASLICGNKSIVRIPSKAFRQVDIINRAIKNTLNDYDSLRPYICLIKYGHEKEINDALSLLADIRIVWGGDNTISEIRESKLNPRATEITFADRYSLLVVDSDYYMSIEDKNRIAKDFYNDTYLSDQNACTSPCAVVWVGNHIKEAKEQFWNEVDKIVDIDYAISAVQVINKLTKAYVMTAKEEGTKQVRLNNKNKIIRICVQELKKGIIEYKENSGFFFEYECGNIMEIREFCDDVRFQTISYCGNKEMLVPLVSSGVAGIDRVVPIGHTMDFDLIWDGYNLFERMTRTITVY